MKIKFEEFLNEDIFNYSDIREKYIDHINNHNKNFLNEQEEWDPFGEETKNKDIDPTIEILKKLNLSFIFDHELTLYPQWPPVKVIVYSDENYVELSFDNLWDKTNYLKEFYRTNFSKIVKIRTINYKYGKFNNIVKYEKIKKYEN